VRTYVDLQSKQAERHRHSFNFQELVAVAADTDSLKVAITRPASNNASSGSGRDRDRAKSTSTSNLSPSNLDNSQSVPRSSSRPNRIPRNWAAEAKKWQLANPVADKSKWYSLPTRKPDYDLQCYNCGQLDRHFSSNCDKTRMDPEKAPVYVASLTQLSPSLPKITEVVESGKGDDE
jgi:hypothetical protein